MQTFHSGGVYLKDNKLSANRPIETMGLPQIAVFSLAGHIGVPAIPVVHVGDSVRVGQLIGRANGFLSANVHSSVSGVVTHIDTIKDAWDTPINVIAIAVQGDVWDSSIIRDKAVDRINQDTPEEIIRKIRDAGIVGLGGACFPTHVKLTIPLEKRPKVLIINACECEPYLTNDHQLILEHGEEILVGVSLLMKALQVKQAIIGIEDNKKDAFLLLEKWAMSHFGISVVRLKTRYPQGSEKQLIQALTNKHVPRGGLPVDIGVVMQNISTAFAVYEAVQKGKPLIDRVMTITGDHFSNCGNYRVRLGLPIQQLIDQLGGLPEDTGKVISGGPMMGRAMAHLDMPVSKNTPGLLFVPKKDSERGVEMACIRCAACVRDCPVGLEPYMIAKMVKLNHLYEAQERDLMDCIECGCCSYICPSNLPLLDLIRTGKTAINNRKKEGKRLTETLPEEFFPLPKSVERGSFL